MPMQPAPDADSSSVAPDPAPRASKAALGRYLETLLADIAARPLADAPSVLISGAVRCGKTKVANRVAARGEYVHLKTDQIRNATYLHSSGAEKRRAAKYLFRRILLRFPRGVLIDGTALMDAPCDLPLWARARGIAVFAIGYSAGTPEDKRRDLLAYRTENNCWTKRSKSDAEMLRFARRLIRRSKEIRAYCEDNDLPYYDLDSAHFAKERARIVTDIERRLSAMNAAGAPQGMLARLQFWRASRSL